MTERQFPMLDGPPIPWSLAEVIYAGYAVAHGREQSLERIADRRGFGWAEVAILWRNRHAMRAMMDVIRTRSESP